MDDRLRSARVQEFEAARHVDAQLAFGAPRERSSLCIQVLLQIAIRRILHDLRHSFETNISEES